MNNQVIELLERRRILSLVPLGCRYKLFSLFLCLLAKSPVQFFPTGPPSSSSARFRMILLVGGSPVRLLIRCINVSSGGPESRCLYSEDAAAMETVSPFQRLRRVLSTRPCFVAVPLILGFSCDSNLQERAPLELWWWN